MQKGNRPELGDASASAGENEGAKNQKKVEIEPEPESERDAHSEPPGIEIPVGASSPENEENKFVLPGKTHCPQLNFVPFHSTRFAHAQIYTRKLKRCGLK